MSVFFVRIKLVLLLIYVLFHVEAIRAAEHISVRNIMIESQLTQVETTAVLIVGDSIVESWLPGSTGPCQVINAGMGGGGVRQVITLLSELKQKKMASKLSGIIIAIGVNDAQRASFPENYVVNWKKDYEVMIDIALHLNAKLAISTILPVEDGLPLGSNYFDRPTIEQMNTFIRQVANKKNLRLIDAKKYFQAKVQKKGFTIDGVHLTPDSYKYFTKLMMTGMPANCSSTSFDK